MTALLDPAAAFEKRAARATALVASAPTVAEPLVFAAKAFRLQGRLAAAVASRHEETPFSGGAGDLPLSLIHI